MPLRVKQALLVGAGALIALVMLWLGLWQMQVFTDQGNRSAADRAAQPPVPLLDFVGPDGSVGDIYGKRVDVIGRYLPGQQIVVRAADGSGRVLTALLLSDGRVLPVVRGQGAAGTSVPPAGEVTRQGIFLPSEPGAEHAVAPGELASVRLPQLAQLWAQPLLPGFVTLRAEDAAAEGMEPAGVTLPSGDGSLRNGGYALQWWVFAAFGFGMSLQLARTLGRREALAREEAARALVPPGAAADSGPAAGTG